MDGRVVAPLLLAERYRDRLRGMLGRRPLPPALVISPCTSVHTWWMGESIDVALLDGDQRVLRVRTMKPWCYFGARGTKIVLEAPVGSFARWKLEDDSIVSWTISGQK